MSIFKYLCRRKKPTAQTAKERLQIIISHERIQRDGMDYLPQLKNDIVEVLAKYMSIDKELVNVSLERHGDHSILELNITMPDKVLAEA